jgi:hypothetical protein
MHDPRPPGASCEAFSRDTCTSMAHLVLKSQRHTLNNEISSTRRACHKLLQFLLFACLAFATLLCITLSRYNASGAHACISCTRRNGSSFRNHRAQRWPHKRDSIDSLLRSKIKQGTLGVRLELCQAPSRCQAGTLPGTIQV